MINICKIFKVFVTTHQNMFTTRVFSIVMAGMAPEGSQFDARQYDNKMKDL